jgi:predicted Ser/Thr protein kinase
MVQQESQSAAHNANALQVESLCTKCGAYFHPETGFCGLDGTELVPCDSSRDSAQHLPYTAMQCSQCGQKYPPYAKYCGGDGTALTTWVDPGPTDTPLQEPGEEAQPAKKGMTNLKEVTEWVNKGTVTLKKDKATEGNLTKLEMNFAEERPRRLIQEDSLEMDSPASELALVGKTLEGKYLIQSVLAEGGMAVLYIARHTTMERTVVVKVVHGALNSSPNALQRFEREAKVLARLNHPNIVAVYDFGFINKKQPFLIMEYIKGMNLADKVQQHGSPTVPVATQIIMQICRGLEEAHATGIIHRDLKPDNIILQEKVDRPDWVKIVDFGIAHLLDSEGKRLTRAGRITGTPEYMSPEQFKDKPLDFRADIYSLGIVIFELITGRLPFEADDLGVLMAKQLMDVAPSVSTLREDIPEGSPMDLLIKKCLEKEPDQRYQSAAELRRAAETIAASYR